MRGRVIKINLKKKFNILFQNVKKPVAKNLNQVLKAIAKVRVVKNIHQINKKKAVVVTEIVLVPFQQLF